MSLSIAGGSNMRGGLPERSIIESPSRPNELDYLETNGVWTHDQRMMFGAAWGFFSAGAHPGLTPRERARIGVLLSIEFSSVLISSWLHWKQTRP